MDRDKLSDMEKTISNEKHHMEDSLLKQKNKV